jgi:transaldolase
MNPLEQLHQRGQSIWLDNIRRELLTSGELARYIKELSVTGLTSNPTIFEKAIGGSTDYDQAIAARLSRNLSTQSLFEELAIEDLQQAADLFKAEYADSKHLDGFVSLEVSPKLADDAQGTIAEAKRLFASAQRDNLFIKVPGTPNGCAAIEELIFAGIPINVTLLFSVEQYQASAEAYLRGIERRIKAGLSPYVGSVASLFVSRWDVKSNQQLPEDLHNKLGVAMAAKAYAVYLDLLDSDRWQTLSQAGAHPQKLLMASTGSKDPRLPDTYYVTALAGAGTVNTIPENTLLAFADSGIVNDDMSAHVAEADQVLNAIAEAGVDIQAMSQLLLEEGKASFVKSFDQLMQVLRDKSAQVAKSSHS